MLGTALHWVEGPWKGRLALAARPRGGDWLDGEMAWWRSAGVDTVVSLLESAEEEDLELSSERFVAGAKGMTFHSLPIPDRGVPESEAQLFALVDTLDRELGAGRNVTVHCRQGVGRTGLLAACLLMAQDYAPTEAVERLSDARGTQVPETIGQREWIEAHADRFAAPGR